MDRTHIFCCKEAAQVKEMGGHGKYGKLFFLCLSLGIIGVMVYCIVKLFGG
jgi:hypothetical protein